MWHWTKVDDDTYTSRNMLGVVTSVRRVGEGWAWDAVAEGVTMFSSGYTTSSLFPTAEDAMKAADRFGREDDWWS